MGDRAEEEKLGSIWSFNIKFLPRGQEVLLGQEAALTQGLR